MYKVFINDNFLILSKADCEKINGIKTNKFSSPRQIQKWIIDAENIFSRQCLQLLCEDPAQVLEWIKKSYKYIEAAGGLVKNKNDRFLFIFRRGKWDLPKGKINKNESTEQAAIREVIEETGLKNISITEKISDTYHFYRAKGNLVLKKTYWYAMENLGDDKLIPQIEEDIELAEWVKEEQVKNLMQNIFGSVADVLKTAKIISKLAN